MKKNIFVTGLLVAAVATAGISVYAAETDVVDTITERMGGMHGERGQKGKGLENALEEGIITEDELEAIQAYREANRPDREDLADELDGLTRDEVKAYMEENYPRPEDPMAELVDEGIITQDQADALQALKPEGAGEGVRGFGSRGQRGGNDFSAAVEAGVLTQEEADAIIEYREANRPDMEALADELDGLSRDEVKAYMEENYPRPEDPMAELVEAGLIDEEQAEELEALKPEGNGEGRQQGPGQRGQGGRGSQGGRGQGGDQNSGLSR